MNNDEARAKLLSSGWSAETLGIWLRAEGMCEYCDKDLQHASDDFFHGYNIDHIVPASRGGVSDATNYALACRACNLIKRNQDFRNGADGVSREDMIKRARVYIRAERERNDRRMKEAIDLLRILGLQHHEPIT